MKTALQEAEDAEGDGEAEKDGKLRLKDAKGREILSAEEKAKKEEKENQGWQGSRKGNPLRSSSRFLYSKFGVRNHLTSSEKKMETRKE